MSTFMVLDIGKPRKAILDLYDSIIFNQKMKSQEQRQFEKRCVKVLIFIIAAGVTTHVLCDNAQAIEQFFKANVNKNSDVAKHTQEVNARIKREMIEKFTDFQDTSLYKFFTEQPQSVQGHTNQPVSNMMDNAIAEKIAKMKQLGYPDSAIEKILNPSSDTVKDVNNMNLLTDYFANSSGYTKDPNINAKMLKKLGEAPKGEMYYQILQDTESVKQSISRSQELLPGLTKTIRGIHNLCNKMVR